MSNFPTDCNNNFQKSKEITRHRVFETKEAKERIRESKEVALPRNDREENGGRK